MSHDEDDETAEGITGMLEAARAARQEREQRLGSIFGGAKNTYDQRQDVLKGLFTRNEAPDEPSPLSGFVQQGKDSKDARQKQEAQLFEEQRQARAQEQRDMAKRLFGRDPEAERKAAETPPPAPKKTRKKSS